MNSLLEQYKELDGANKFLAEHCGKTLEDQAKLIKGISHSVNRCNADYAECWENIKELQKTLDSMSSDIRDINAAIGSLQERVQKLEKSIDNARKAYSELKKK